MDSDIIIQDHKLFQYINGALYDTPPEDPYEKMCGVFKEFGAGNSGFDPSHFSILFEEGKANTDKRIDCICYVMKCVLKDRGSLEFFDTLYRQLTKQY